MKFRPEAIKQFMELFEGAAPVIRNMPGCRRLELWQDVRIPNMLVTYSIWDDEEALDRYRQSIFFRETWGRAKHLFSAPAQATSQRVVEALERAN